MSGHKNLPPNELFVEVSGAGIPDVDGLFVPSTAPPAKSESGTVSSVGYWNGKLAWDRADGKCERRPSLSYSNSYSSWRIARLDGHLAYHITCHDELPPTDRPWDVYKMGVAPAPTITLHYCDPREPCPPPNIVFVLGGPGAGKGTMCELAEAQLGWHHLSVGELLRAEHKSGSELGVKIDKLISAGNLAPDDVVVNLLRQEMERLTRTTGRNNFLLDGFPRSAGNLEEWNRVFGPDADLPSMLYLECPYEVLEQRILGRAKFTGRSDDNIESLKRRFETFKAQTLPTVEFFRQQGKCVEIDTSQSRTDVYREVVNGLADFTDKSLASRPLSERAEMLLGLRPFPRK